jgi:hypothetical protein
MAFRGLITEAGRPVGTACAFAASSPVDVLDVRRDDIEYEN